MSVEATAVVQQRVIKSELGQWQQMWREREEFGEVRSAGLVGDMGRGKSPYSSQTFHCDFLTMSPWKGAIRWEIERIMGADITCQISQDSEGNRGTRC